jgi:hypothetical protein
MNTNTSLTQLTETKLLQRFAALVELDRSNTAQLLAHLAEIDARKLWAKHACPSMFAFCMERFHMSESATFKRIWAARTARRFPVIFQMIAYGELHLSGVTRLGKHLTEENHHAVLARAKHKTSRQIDLLVAELAPRPDVPSRVRAVPRTHSPTVAATNAGTEPKLGGDSLPARAMTEASVRLPDTTSAQPAVQAKIQPLAPRRFKIEITVDQTTHDHLRVLQDLLRHQLPGADPAAIVSRAIELLLDETLKKKAAMTETTRTAGTERTASATGRASATHANRTRAIPAAIRRQIWKRDVGRCAFVDEKGRRCRATSFLEFHHEVPYGKGGKHESANIALRCRSHNQYQADLDFGVEFMRGKRSAVSQQSPGHVRCSVPKLGRPDLDVDAWALARGFESDDDGLLNAGTA